MPHSGKASSSSAAEIVIAVFAEQVSAMIQGFEITCNTFSTHALVL
jgi:hypothetical protein